MRMSVATAVALTLISISHGKDAEAAIRRPTSIEPQTLGAALQVLAKQRDVQLVYRSELTNARNTSGAAGDLTLEEALRQLLEGTGLTFQYLEEKAITIVPENQTVPEARVSASHDEAKLEGGAPQTAEANGGVWNRFRLAQNSSSGTKEEGARGSGKVRESGDDQRVEEYVPTAGKAIPEILVTGSKSTNVDIRRTENDIQPYVVFDHAKLVRAGSVTVDEFLKTQLPMNAGSSTEIQASNFSNGVSGTIDLRGLGTNQTLILVDGRRLPATPVISGSFDQTDISGIPLSAIERIEVLPVSAGAIYGGAATGGVINIVRKRDFSGLDLGVSYGNSFSHDVQNLRYHLNGGFSYGGGAGSATLSAAYSRVDPLLVAERDFAQRSRLLTLRNQPELLTSAGTPAPSTTRNICAAAAFGSFGFCDGSQLTLNSGQALGASITSVPVGYAGPASDAGAALAGQAGSYNLDTPQDGQYLLRAPTQKSLSLSVRQSLNKVFEFQLTGADASSKNLLSNGDPSLSILVPAGMSNNPFEQDVLVNLSLPSTSYFGRVDTRTALASAAVVAHLPRQWSVSAERTWGRVKYAFSERSGSVLSPAGVALLQASSALFEGTNQNLPDLTPFISLNPDFIGGPVTQIQEGTALRASGPLFKLPAGAMTLTVLAEHRNEHSRDAYFNSLGDFAFVSFTPRRWQSVTSVYLEGLAPLFGAPNRLPLVDALELQASIRRDAYKTTSADSGIFSEDGSFSPPPYVTNRVSSIDSLFGLRYSPVKDVAVRVSRSTAFLPPGLDQLVPFVGLGRGGRTTMDPLRGGTAIADGGLYTRISGGNADLQPETSRSQSVGAIFTPRHLEGLRVSLDYSHIKKKGEITTPGTQFLVDNESIYPDRVVRGPNLPTDPVGWAGPITQLDATFINLLSTSVKALDMQFAYRLPTHRWGTLDLSAVATRVSEFKRQVAATTPIGDSVGYLGSPLRWKGVSQLGWERGPWAAVWMSQYYNSYLVYTSTSSPMIVEGTVALQGSDRIPKQWYHDLWFSYRIGAADHPFFGGTSFSLKIENIFNKEPPILATNSSNLYSSEVYSAYGDPRLRRYFFSIQKSFGR